MTVTKTFVYGDGDGDKKNFFGDDDGDKKFFFSVTVTKKFFSVRMTVDSTRDTPSCLKNFEQTRGVFRPSLSNFVFRNFLGKGGTMAKNFEKKF